ncbi:hypothetical protein [Pedobacter endophyticus]|uniref:Glycosyltransferase RgtA/B/C/D-like domain-containing protein n=1 Tax=Pedobacter endophyticus TaxID=2789740 RepID=A0A7U3SPP9_9SPHI|nr:hypothetical protein [Pedobacter endophyticus]QPH38723.1 hypothetical protein IZT61_16850 [Pedobacter endophyticus]
MLTTIKYFFQGKTYLRTIAEILLYGYLLFWWSWKLNSLPGLHGDEAWMGIMADSYKTEGFHSIYGMNHYTGILQALSSYLSFYFFESGVGQLRIPGVLFNLIGVIIISRILKAYSQQSSILFLLFIGQSAIYLILPRIAWEVNSFTMILMAIYLLVVTKIVKTNAKPRPILIILFLMINLLGTYNHIIYASVSFAALFGLLIWSGHNKTYCYKNLIILLFVNLFNLAALHILMSFFNVIFDVKYGMIWGSSIIILVLLEVHLFAYAFEMDFNFKIRIPRYVVLIIASAGLATFVFCHGLAFFDVLTNYKIFLNIYSYPVALGIKAFFIFPAIILCISCIYHLWKDVFSFGKTTVPGIILISYLGIFSLFTVHNSVRYYLIIFILIALYLSLKVCHDPKASRTLYLSLVFSFFLSALTLFKAFFLDVKGYKVLEVNIGNEQIESSGHFLPKKNLVDSLRKYRVGKIEYMTDQYFIEEPVMFYKLANPWKEDKRNHAIIDYRGSRGGFIIIIKN